MCEYSATGRTAGEEGSSTYEGRHLSFIESDLTHKTGNTGGLVYKGDPVNIGNIVGVAFKGAAAATDIIAIDTEGIWYLNVVASDGSGTSNIVVGDDLYIATGIVSKIATGIPFGKALSPLTGSATAAVAAVKVHMPVPESTMLGTKFNVTYPNFAAADMAKMFFTAPASCKCLSAEFNHTTVAGQAGTFTVEKCNTGEAAGAGDVILASAFDAVGTTLVPQSKTSTLDAAASMVTGDTLRLKLASGAVTSLADATLTLLMEWI